MTLQKAFSALKAALQDGGTEDFALEAACLFEKATGVSRQTLVCHGEDPLDRQAESELRAMAARRLSGEPLQYILGEWDFCDLTFSVGEGVLIPRPETELLVEAADGFLRGKTGTVVYDLCAGSGALGLTVARHNPDCTVYLFEKYDGALHFLRKNAARLALPNVQILEWDILAGAPAGLPRPNLLVSNPPYVPTAELPDLQREVLFEPQTALDGGADGLCFYRAICEKWLPRTERGAMLLFECGDGQAQAVSAIFREKTREQKIIYDWNSIDRAVQIIV